MHELLGGTGVWSPTPRVDEVTDLDDGSPYPIITGDYAATPAWSTRPVAVGTPVEKPTPIFTKLDTAVMASKLSRQLRGVADEFLVKVNRDRPEHLEAILAPSIVPAE